MGMLPRNPWYQGITFADYIMISGIDEAASYAEAQVDPAKLLFYGSHEFDLLYERWSNREELRHNLTKAYQLDSSNRILVMTLPRLLEQNLASEEVHWQSINEILDVLSKQDYNLLISLHPQSDPAQYAWIEAKYPVKICSERLTDILVVADIFVASYSSTIRWAIGLGIPVINLDFWSLNYKIFRNLAGYQTVTTLADFGELVRKLASTSNDDWLTRAPTDINFSADDILGPSEGSKTTGSGVIIDGMAKERLRSFVESLACND